MGWYITGDTQASKRNVDVKYYLPPGWRSTRRCSAHYCRCVLPCASPWASFTLINDTHRIVFTRSKIVLVKAAFLCWCWHYTHCGAWILWWVPVHVPGQDGDKTLCEGLCILAFHAPPLVPYVMEVRQDIGGEGNHIQQFLWRCICHLSQEELCRCSSLRNSLFCCQVLGGWEAHYLIAILEML